MIRRLAVSFLAAALCLACGLHAQGCSDSSGGLRRLGFHVQTTSLPRGDEGQSYSTFIRTDNGTAPVTYTVFQGTLPGGLGLDQATGEISGVPTMEGEVADVTFRIIDGAGLALVPSYTLIINKRIIFLTTNLPTATAFAPYLFQLQASGGTPPYQWEITSGSLPIGMTFNRATAQLVGNPQSRGTFPLTFTVRDQTNAAGQAVESLNVQLVVQ